VGFHPNILCDSVVLEKFSAAIEANPEIKNALTATTVSQILTPIDVLKLFERIPQSDIPLLAMDGRRFMLDFSLIKKIDTFSNSRSQPKDLIFTRMLVPPVSIRPSVVSDLKAGTYVFYCSYEVLRVISLYFF
jgi:DNA-directed RNA polymerase III subunit RPC1